MAQISTEHVPFLPPNQQGQGTEGNKLEKQASKRTDNSIIY